MAYVLKDYEIICSEPKVLIVLYDTIRYTIFGHKYLTVSLNIKIKINAITIIISLLIIFVISFLNGSQKWALRGLSKNELENIFFSNEDFLDELVPYRCEKTVLAQGQGNNAFNLT